MNRDPKELLAGYATDTLTEEERRELLRAALDDQELFDALVEEDGLRDLLQDPAARQELLAVLEQPTAWERVRAWFEREATLLDLAAIAAVAVAAIVGYGLLSLQPTPLRAPVAAARPVGSALSARHVAALLRLPEQPLVPAGIEVVNRPQAAFAPGETMQLRVSLRAPARIAILEEAPGGSMSQLWPGLGQPPAFVPKPAAGGPAVELLTLEAPAGRGAHRLRLVVAPEDLDLGALSPDALGAASSRLTLVDLHYRVVTRS